MPDLQTQELLHTHLTKFQSLLTALDGVVSTRLSAIETRLDAFDKYLTEARIAVDINDAPRPTSGEPISTETFPKMLQILLDRISAFENEYKDALSTRIAELETGFDLLDAKLSHTVVKLVTSVPEGTAASIKTAQSRTFDELLQIRTALNDLSFGFATHLQLYHKPGALQPKDPPPTGPGAVTA